jgi:regulator of protease activity HflC (stomatin/prohibitin superfamily)
MSHSITSHRIDLRESVFNFLQQEVYTKDTVLLDVNALMYYSIFDIKKAIYEVEDLQGALSNTAQTQLKVQILVILTY